MPILTGLEVSAKVGLLVANDNERKALGIGRVRPSGLDMALVFILDLSIESIQMFYSIQVVDWPIVI